MVEEKIKIDDNDLFEKLELVGEEVDKELDEFIEKIKE